MWKMTADEQQSDEGETTALQREDQTGTAVADSCSIIGGPPSPDDVLCSECFQTRQPAVASYG